MTEVRNRKGAESGLENGSDGENGKWENGENERMSRMVSENGERMGRMVSEEPAEELPEEPLSQLVSTGLR